MIEVKVGETFLVEGVPSIIIGGRLTHPTPTEFVYLASIIVEDEVGWREVGQTGYDQKRGYLHHSPADLIVWAFSNVGKTVGELLDKPHYTDVAADAEVVSITVEEYGYLPARNDRSDEMRATYSVNRDKQGNVTGPLFFRETSVP